MDIKGAEEFLDAIGFKVVRAGDDIVLPDAKGKLVVATAENGLVAPPDGRHGPKGR